LQSPSHIEDNIIKFSDIKHTFVLTLDNIVYKNKINQKIFELFKNWTLGLHYTILLISIAERTFLAVSQDKLHVAFALLHCLAQESSTSAPIDIRTASIILTITNILT